MSDDHHVMDDLKQPLATISNLLSQQGPRRADGVDLRHAREIGINTEIECQRLA